MLAGGERNRVDVFCWLNVCVGVQCYSGMSIPVAFLNHFRVENAKQ